MSGLVAGCTCEVAPPHVASCPAYQAFKRSESRRAYGCATDNGSTDAQTMLAIMGVDGEQVRLILAAYIAPVIDLLRRWRDAALEDDASALADLTNETTDFLERADAHMYADDEYNGTIPR